MRPGANWLDVSSLSGIVGLETCFRATGSLCCDIRPEWGSSALGGPRLSQGPTQRLIGRLPATDKRSECPPRGAERSGSDSGGSASGSERSEEEAREVRRKAAEL